ncbi:MAG: copper chaperone PCu(A)C [Sphingomonas sp.]|nr:copper chaperone PCu(A)C [Sphingomonas sp.]
MLALLACDSKQDSAPAIQPGDAWVRATLPGKSTTAAYFTLRNSGGGDRLLKVSAADGDASLHSTSMDGGVMRMRPLDSLEIPGGAVVALKPGGTHVMIVGLNRPLEAGQELPIALKFERSGTIRVAAVAKSAAQAMEH